MAAKAKLKDITAEVTKEKELFAAQETEFTTLKEEMEATIAWAA